MDSCYNFAIACDDETHAKDIATYLKSLFSKDRIEGGVLCCYTTEEWYFVFGWLYGSSGQDVGKLADADKKAVLFNNALYYEEHDDEMLYQLCNSGASFDDERHALNEVIELGCYRDEYDEWSADNLESELNEDIAGILLNFFVHDVVSFMSYMDSIEAEKVEY